jgi:ribosome biogenesis GTPase
LTLMDYGYMEKIEKTILKCGGLPSDNTLARVIGDYGTGFAVIHEGGSANASLAGSFQNGANKDEMRPVTGDWVAVRIAPGGGTGVITKIYPRFSEMRRSDTVTEWKNTHVAANFDFVFLMVSLNSNFTLSRVERLVTAAWASGGTPVVLLSKADLTEGIESLISSVSALVPGVDVVAISAITGYGIEKVSSYMKSGITCALVGSSGVGKSTLLNLMMGQEVAKTAEIRKADSKGRHTTSNRALYLLPSGGLILDTPGIRAYGLNEMGSNLERTFSDIEELAGRCRFTDCSHTGEPGCAVLMAIEDKSLDERRLASYLRMQKELEHVKAKSENSARLIRKRRQKGLAKLIRATVK